MSRPQIGIVISFYDARPPHHLYALLEQLDQIGAGSEGSANQPFDTTILVVANTVDGGCSDELRLPAHVRFVRRPNAGFNIGAWDAGWRSLPTATHFIFLQDECELRSEQAIERYWRLLQRGGDNVVVGESLQIWAGWSAYQRSWPECHDKIKCLAQGRGWEVGACATHLQTLALGVSAAALRHMGGFLSADEKIEAIANEVLLSKRAESLGLGLRQSDWRPFTCFRHPQWDPEWVRSATFGWRFKRALRLLSYRTRILFTTNQFAVLGGKKQ